VVKAVSTDTASGQSSRSVKSPGGVDGRYMVQIAFQTAFCPMTESRPCLCGRPIVVAEDPADSLPATHRANRSLRRRTIDELVRKLLVIPLAMVVHGELLQCSP
jgi:hypothetical protein